VIGQIVRLNGYVVKKQAGKNDQPLSPAGSVPALALLARPAALSGSAAAVYSSAADLPPGWLAVLDITLFSQTGSAPQQTPVGPWQPSDSVFGSGGLTEVWL
jgi:hypothetical protein